MKIFIFSFLALLSISAFARDRHDPQMKACMDELRQTSQLSESCQEFFDQKEERKQKIQECIAQVDGTDTASDDSDSTEDTTTTDVEE